MDKNRVIYYGEVIDNKDPLNLGRIRCYPKNWQIQSYERGLPTGELENSNDKWTLNDPFLVYPLLPIFFYQVPKEKEFVHVIFYDKDRTENNKFYIQGNFSDINEINQQSFNDMVNGLALGERNKPKNNKLTPNTTIPVNPENIGLYPEPGTIGLLGRKNSDILLPEEGFITRVNKENRNEDGSVTFNKKYSFSMLQKYPSREDEKKKIETTTTEKVYQNIQYLIEYDVYGGLGTNNGKFSAYVEIYKISPYSPINTSQLTGTTKFINASESSKIGPIFRKDYQPDTFENITNGIKDVISNLNNSKIGLTGNIIQQISNSFPFYFQPKKNLYDKSVGPNGVEQTNAKRFIENIFLNELDSSRGYGLVSEKNKLGLLTDTKQTSYFSSVIGNQETSVSMSASDFKFILSHDSAIPGLQKINFDDIPNYEENILNQDFIWNTIYPNTNSMVRGEKLMDLIELIIKYLINHVHPFHNMPPVPVAKDQTTTQEILTEINNAYETILNNKLRIN